MSYQLKKVRLLSYKLHAAFTPSAHFRPKKAPRAIFSRGGGRVYFGVNGQFLCLGGPSYGHWKTMRVVLKNFFDLTPLSPYPTEDQVIPPLLGFQWFIYALFQIFCHPNKTFVLPMVCFLALPLQVAFFFKVGQCYQLQTRVAKCHRYGRYICVKISKSWGKKFVGIQNR